MISLVRKELGAFLSSLIGYITILVFLSGIGLFLWVFPSTSLFEYGYADLGLLFGLGPYVYLFLIPAITMRSFAEEKREGTLELLLTKPLSDWQVVLGKYLAALLLVLFALLPTLVYYYSVYQLGEPVGNIDSASVIGSYLGLFLLGAAFTAIGILASASTQSQIVSFLLAVFLCFVIHDGFGQLATLEFWGGTANAVEELGIAYHYDAMSRGLIDSRNVIYLLSLIFLMLALTKLILGSRRWDR